MEGPRALRANELDELIALVNGVFRAGGGRMRECFPTLFCEENLDNVRIIKEDGRIVSHIGVCVRDVISQGVRFTVGNIGAVCTHDDYRKRGYAEALLRRFNAKLRDDGVDLLFVSGDRSLYRRHGCARVGKVLNFAVTAADSEKLARSGVRVELTDFTPHPLPLSHNGRGGLRPDEDLSAEGSGGLRQLDEFSRIHQREPVRFHRTRDDWRALVREGNPVSYLRHERRFYTIAGESGEQAYIVLHVGDGAATHTYVTEYAGARGALAGALSELVRELGEIKVPVPEWDHVLSQLLRAKGFAENVTSAGGTVCILNLPQLAEKIRPLLAERVARADAEALQFEETNAGWRVSLASDALEFDNDGAGEGWMSIARLIFGTPDNSHMKDWPDNHLMRVLRAAFPIARPEYGLSYI